MSLDWSAQFAVASSAQSTSLKGDRILLPSSALEELLAAAPVVVSESSTRSHTTAFDPYNPYTYAAEREARAQAQERQQQLPYPLTFRLVNPSNGRVVYAGIREFSADEGEVALGDFLREALDLPAAGSSPPTASLADNPTAPSQGPARVTVHSKQLPKGTYVKLRPLEAGYGPEDWKAILEQHLRANFTTLTKGEVLLVPRGHGAGGHMQEFKFLVDGFKPESDGICVVDTDLEVDIEPLNEEQARETLRKLAAPARAASQSQEGSSVGGTLDLFGAREGRVLDGEYVDYEIPSWDRSQGLCIELSASNPEDELDLMVSPHGPRQRAHPRIDRHVFADFGGRYPRQIRIRPTNVELQEADSIWVSVHAFSASSAEDAADTASPKPFQIRALPFEPETDQGAAATIDDETPPNVDDVRCKNCHQWVPQGRLFLHENFCLRNNVLCPQGCGEVFQKRSFAFQNHWHCPLDTFHGNSDLSHKKHDYIYHTPQICPSCSRSFQSVAELAMHRTSTCPAKLILCRFCHLEVPQEGDPDAPSAEALLSGLTPHELADGSRTTECHLCDKIVRLRDMETHLKHHGFERLSRPVPRCCRNVNCGRTLDGTGKKGDTRAGTRMGQGPGNDAGLCSVCFGPLYVSMYDPDGKALKRRVERRYLTQLLTGCRRSWCRNEFCKTGRQNMGIQQSVSSKEAMQMARPSLETFENKTAPLHFCTDEGSQTRREFATVLAETEGSKGGWSLEWCVAALEAEAGDLSKAKEWLQNWAPQKSESA